jgi:HD-like signal output (HDOD) protein
VATAAEAARRADPAARSDAFTAGLLSDVGVLLLAAKAPELLGRDESDLGFTHGGLGAYLLGLWGLPPRVVEAVAFHHDPVVVGPEVVAVHEGNHSGLSSDYP